MVVLGGPGALVRVVDEILDVARVDGVLCLLGRLGLVKLRGGGVAREEVADELVPGAADVDAVEPPGGLAGVVSAMGAGRLGRLGNLLVELSEVLEGEKLEDQTLML